MDHRVDVPALGGEVRVGEVVLVLLDQLRAAGVRVVGVVEVVAGEDVDGALRAHHRDLGGRPREGHVGAEVLGPQHVVGAAVGLAGDDRDQRGGRLGVGGGQLRTAADGAV